MKVVHRIIYESTYLIYLIFHVHIHICLPLYVLSIFCLRTLGICSSNTWNMLFEHLDHVVRTPRICCSNTWEGAARSLHASGIFEQHVLDIRTACLEYSNNIFPTLEQISM